MNQRKWPVRSHLKTALLHFAALACCISYSTASLAQSYGSGYTDPAGSGAIVGAVNWLRGTLLGTVATVVAVIAIAAVGFMMLTGRMNWRYGATVILGTFILFGAASIVAGIQSTAGMSG
jgi:type IV secretion system protein VirB2